MKKVIYSHMGINDYMVNQPRKNGAVIVENRFDVDAIVEAHKKYLPIDWNVLHFDAPISSEREYNLLLTSKEFWENIPFDKVLIFQHDSLLLRHGIKDFLQYDFVGAQIFHEHLPMPCMNGGLSLRSKSKMLEVIEKIPYDYNLHGNEDIYFCRGIEKIGGNLPTKEGAQSFSVESVFSLGSLGCHAIDKYLTPEQCELILNQYK